MSGGPAEERPDTPAEVGLVRLLDPLREQRPHPGAELVAIVLRRVRFQRALRAALNAAGAVAGTVADAFRSLFEGSRRPR